MNNIYSAKYIADQYDSGDLDRGRLFVPQADHAQLVALVKEWADAWDLCVNPASSWSQTYERYEKARLALLAARKKLGSYKQTVVGPARRLADKLDEMDMHDRQ